MGNKQSEQTKDFQIQINHPRFSKSKILTRETEKYLQTSQAIDEKEYDKWKQALAKYKDIPDNLLLPKTHTFSRAGLCGNTGTLLINYNNYPYLLIEEIYNRKGLKGRFSENQLWELLFALVQARRQALTVGERLGDIRPRNIFLNQNGRIKVANSLSWPLEITNIQKSFDKTPTYLSPEDLAKIQKGEVAEAPSDESEAFSIGLSILSAGNLTEYEDLYNLQTHELDLARLSEALRAWAFNLAYSEVLRGTLLLLLNVHPERRLSSTQLATLLTPHSEAILKKENFVINNAPAKLHEQILHLRTTLAQVQPVILPPVIPFGAPSAYQPILVVNEPEGEAVVVEKQ